MRSKLWDIYGIMGLLVTINIAFIKIYKISWIYVTAIIAGLSVLAIVMVLSNKFSKIEKEIEIITDKVEKNQNEITILDKRFKTLEDLSKIRFDVYELQKKVFKK